MLTKNCEQNFLGGEKAEVSCSVEVLGSQTGIPKGLKKVRNSGGEEGLMTLEFGGHGGRGFWDF